LLSAVITLEGDERFRTDCGDLFLVPLRIVHRIGRNLANGEVLSRRVQQLRQLGEVARIPVQNHRSGDDMGFDTAHQVHLGPYVLGHPTILHIRPTDEPIANDTSGINREYCFDGNERKAAFNQQIVEN
jgi:hypothetical protein